MTYTEALKGILIGVHAVIVSLLGFLLYATQYIETSWLQLTWILVFSCLVYASYIVRDYINEWLEEKVYFEK
jgi:hypothetical protein